MRRVVVPTSADVTAATEVVHRHLVPTPVLVLDDLGPGVVAKLEVLAPTGSFKVRGGLNAVTVALERQAGTPLVAASAGNHGLGVAWAADRLGAKATVVVAETASEAKVRALGRFGADLVRFGASYDEAEEYALGLAAERGWRYVSPYNDPDVIAGQGSVGAELLAQVPDLDTIVVPVGGGGLVSGIGLATASAGTRIVGVEPETSASMAAALAAGRAVPVDLGETMADGLAGNIEPGSVTVELARRRVDHMVSVSEAEIAEAVRYLALEHGLVTEPSGAVGVAALRSGRLGPDGATTAVVLTGRNISADLLVALCSGGAA
ncbi:MAG TPA: pyridoxal-phosphate dependent enzyme [Acidimicrobiales bacterium]|nr:pyridoxal-phosphate dependent enzyme [Acidimicrobiales bacterium]